MRVFEKLVVAYFFGPPCTSVIWLKRYLNIL